MVGEMISFAVGAHNGQFRRNGVTPYIIHPLRVLDKLINWGVRDETTLMAAIGHDLIEDTRVTYSHIKDRFGFKVADLINELTFFPSKMSKDVYLESFANKSTAALVIKTADRIDNLIDSKYDGANYRWKLYYEAARPLYYNMNRLDGNIYDKMSNDWLDLREFYLKLS